MSDPIDLAFLGRQSAQILEELCSLKKDVADVRDIALLTSDYARRLDRRIAESRDDIELVVKSEIGGRIAHLETTLENALAQLAERVATLESN